MEVWQVDSFVITVVMIAIIIISLMIAVPIIIIEGEKKRIRELITNLANHILELTQPEFEDLRTTSFGGQGRPSYANQYNFPGVYILHNKTRDMYYVGQGKQV